MGKKIPAIVVLAALGTEVVLNERHEPAVFQQPHTEADVKTPVEIKAINHAGGSPNAVSGTVTFSSDNDAPAQPHIEGGGNDVTDFALDQIGNLPPATGGVINQIA